MQIELARLKQLLTKVQRGEKIALLDIRWAIGLIYRLEQREIARRRNNAGQSQG